MFCLLERLSQPLNFTVTSENAISLQLSWNKPENFNDEIDYYIVSIPVHIAAHGIYDYLYT